MMHEDAGAIRDIKRALRYNDKDFIAHKYQYKIFRRMLEKEDMERDSKYSDEGFGLYGRGDEESDADGAKAKEDAKREMLMRCAKEAITGVQCELYERWNKSITIQYMFRSLSMNCVVCVMLLDVLLCSLRIGRVCRSCLGWRGGRRC